jgi:hypothetical protein
MFWPAGTFDWPGAWIFIAEMGIAGEAISLWLLRRDPDFRSSVCDCSSKRSRRPVQVKLFMIAVQIGWCGWVVVMALDARRWQLSHVPA